MDQVPYDNDGDSLDFSRAVLRPYSCPLLEDNKCPFEATPFNCLFTHPTQDHGRLPKVPYYLCIYHLMNQCSEQTTLPQVRHQDQPVVPRCPNGLHISLEQLVDIDNFACRHYLQIIDFFGADYDRQCGICLEQVILKRLAADREFAILQNCNHCFCSKCMQTYRQQQWSTKCPVCRQEAGQVRYLPHFEDDPKQKSKLFSMFAWENIKKLLKVLVPFAVIGCLLLLI